MSPPPEPTKLYSFWRSLATYRVRVALNLKGLAPEVAHVDLFSGHQHRDDFLAVNPHRAVPALVLDDGGPALFQSMAIVEYLDETYPAPPLLPPDPRGRARVRALAQIVVADAHPLSVPRVRFYLTDACGLDQARLNTWLLHWQHAALRSLEGHLSRDRATGRYCHGDALTIADLCLASQAVGAGFFDLDLAAYPTVKRIADACLAQDAFARAHPLKQPDAPAAS